MEERENLLTAMKPYAPYLVDRVRDADASVRSPLLPTAAHYRIAQASGRPKLVAKRIASGAKVDWATIEPAVLRDNRTAGPAEARTEVKAAFDDRALYIRFRCVEPKALAARPRAGEDASLFEDDTVEAFFDTNRDQASYTHLAVNPLGNRHDGRKTGEGKYAAAWQGEWRATAERGKGEWRVALVVPFATLGVPAPKDGDKWGFNLCRTRRCVAPSRYQALAPMMGGYHRPERFACLIFGRELPPKNLYPLDGLAKAKVGPLPRVARPHDSKGKSRIEIAPAPDGSGKAVHVVVAEAGAYASLTPTIRVEPGRAYRYSFLYRTRNIRPTPKRGTISPRTRMIYADEKGKRTTGTKDYSWKASDALLGADTWATYVHAFKTPPRTRRVNVTTYLMAPGEYWLRDIRFVEID